MPNADFVHTFRLRIHDGVHVHGSGVDARKLPDGSVVALLGDDNADSRVHQALLDTVRANGPEKTAPESMRPAAIWDAPSRRAVLIGDSLSMLPLFHAVDGRTLLVSDHPDGLLALGVRPAVDWRAVQDFMTFFWTLNGRTFFRGISKLQPGGFATPEGTGRYDRWRTEGGLTDPEEAARLLRAALEDEIDRLSAGLDEAGCHLSGGIDSSAVAVLASRSLGAGLTTYGLRFPGIKDETPWIEAVSAGLAGRHVWVEPDAEGVMAALPDIVRVLGEPSCYPSVLSRYLLERACGQRVVFNGRGVDELFSGYAWHLPPHLEDHLERRRVFSRDEIARIFPDLAHSGHEPERDYLALHAEPEAASPLGRSLHVDRHTLLPAWLRIEHAVSASCGHRAAMPALSPRLAALARDLADELLASGSEAKLTFKRAVADLLPPEVVNRPKMGLTLPFSSLLRGEAGRTVRGLIAPENQDLHPEIDLAYLNRRFERHQAGDIDWGWQFWAVSLYLLWKKLYG